FVPTYLLAGVCSMHGRHDKAAFERRVELIHLARAQTQPAEVKTHRPPLYDNLGTLHYPITTNSAQAQRYFDQGLRLAYAFNHFEAWRAFREAQRLDPGCAMCYWGEAWVLGPNINAPMESAAVAPAIAAVKKAQSRMSGASARERSLITALAERYSAAPDAEQAVLNQAFADAMAKVAKRFPKDVDIAAMYADALMNLAPWTYWEPDGRTLQPPVKDLVATLERALSKAPNHPYAIHLYIHAMEASATPARAEAHADRLGEQMPGAGHLVHMPFHIYFNIGRFQDAVAVNRAAIAADEAYLAQAPAANALYAYGYYPHNVHSLLESARMAGDAKTTLETAGKLPGIMSPEMAEAAAWVQLMYAAPYFAHAQFSDPAVTLNLPDPGERFPYVRAMWHYARGVAQAARGDVRAAKDEVAAIAHLEDTADFDALIQGGVPAPDLLSLARHVINGRIAQAQGNYPKAIAAFGHAAALQDNLPYMEPPLWYYPVRQSLGAAYLQAGQPKKAEQAFRASLEKTPNNGWALFGLMRAQQAQGETSAAAQTQTRLAKLWLGDESILVLDRL
ncbi:MAG: tetratricopeptide repeat protein, partial [Nitrococcus sp.]|nr:tetratricopeptide repeat protein [Nitrococcus sp.]